MRCLHKAFGLLLVADKLSPPVSAAACRLTCTQSQSNPAEEGDYLESGEHADDLDSRQIPLKGVE